MVRPRFLAITVAVLLMGGMAENAHAQEPAGFVSTIDDLPLMPGLVEEEGGMVFDSAQGRIVQSYATGWVSEGAVIAFYAETLPQLGWRPDGPGVFRREGEILKVEFPGGPTAAPPLAVGFRLIPAKD
ncbi:MAG: hypothetical protein IIC56_02165 [Proteobacteria bacterium]|nr:hypothetical protein [Pseudomonadota bacterium]